ncbi:hypothetical protein ED733_004455 [Metarhizium rileyi]|uniref:Oligopeptide transporter n=1 Tax=Metarhizium rileyi (strain RCEF 4871) TaxID=1649241 RepID=A0A5C6G7R5_METRR|nr:hypothetical protein ED733_004455 [Metarhizium rileyi]
MPTGDNLAEPVLGAQLRAEAADEKRASLHAAQEHEAGIQNYEVVSDLEGTTMLPTAEELATLRRVPNRIPMKLFTIAFIELCERFSYYGSAVVFTNFIQQPLPPGSTTGADPTQPGALGMGQRASTGITIFNQFWQYFMPLFGAWVADAKWGRYKTISVALGVDLVGHLILILAAIPPVIVRPGASLCCLIAAIIVIGFGSGGFKPNISCLIVEQLGEQRMFVRTLKSGERVLVDPAVTTERIYNWFYFVINVGALVGQLTMVYAETHIGFWLSYTLPTIMLGFCPLVMLWGRRRYVRREPAGSVLVPALRTFMLAQKGRWSVNPVRTYRNLHDGTFWDAVKPSSFTRQTRPPWMTFDDAWVDELRRGFAACAAAVLQRHGIPNDVLSNLNPFALLIFIPLNDFFVYPALRKAGIRFTPIRKITAGFFVGCAAMIWAAVLQYHMYRNSPCGNHASGTMRNSAGQTVKCPVVEINVWAQTGSYVLIALAEVFASITSLEYAYSKAPKNMRSTVQAVALFMTAFASAIGQALVGLASDPLLVWNYALVAILAFVAGTCFYLRFRNLDDHEDELNELPEGIVGKIDSESPSVFKHGKT